MLSFPRAGSGATYSISGTVTGSPATVTLFGSASTTTTVAANGTYTFSGLTSGQYWVWPTQAGYHFSPVSVPVSVLGASVTGVNFAGTIDNSSAYIAFIQSTSATRGRAQTASATFPSNVTADDLIIVGTLVDLNATVSASDSQGNTFTQVAAQPVAANHNATVLVATARSSGPDAITVRVGSGTYVYAVSIHEYFGVSPTVDTRATAQGNSTIPASGSLSTTNANDLIFAWFNQWQQFPEGALQLPEPGVHSA